MFRVYSQHGYIIDRFDDLDAAIAAMRRWIQAAYVLGPKWEVVASKE